MRKRVTGAVAVAGWLWAALAAPVSAHESQPGLLTIDQLTESRYRVSWRSPIYYGQPHPAQLELPADWRAVGEPIERRLSDSELQQRLVEVQGGSIHGDVVRFPGLEGTITDVFVRLSRLDGTEATFVVRPTDPGVELRGERHWTVVALDYLALGFAHILLGADHLLFVLGLLIIVGGRRRLITTITAFTLAHSITLAAATLGYARAPSAPLNVAIALSILFLGPEIVRVWRGETSFTIEHPWVVAFVFGLLHGFGFASGLTTAGLPRAEIPLALATFNIGVELGQIVFVVTALILTRASRVLEIPWPRWAEYAPGYTIGSLGTFWTLQRAWMMFAG